jgi:hypothetical protein
MFRISRLPTQKTMQIQENNPTIEIIINSVKKDFPLLNYVIKYAVMNSLNKVAEVKVIVPPDQIDLCRTFVMTNICKISIVSENEFLSKSIREKIYKNFPDRYGWVLQQFITLDFVLKSKVSGVLQVNSDTFLLRPTRWLDSNFKQILSCSPEYHKPYYLLLNKLNPLFKIKTDPHVTHHMLFQPKFLQKILVNCGINNLTQLLEFAIENCEKDSSPMCVEYELYAHGMLTYFHSKIELLKFGNVSSNWSHKTTNLVFEKKINELSARYNSISFHSYKKVN